ncbi:MAG TPA: ABC transporter permease [Candidatus Nanoarchaeia archaeon]|nr:ABC transporter permease [Candidatus Nanoarchaeia archaeon]
MKKLISIISKNFKILLRSKASAFVVIAGPLLLIALISLALSNSQEYSISVGVVSLDKSELALQFTSQLERDHTILNYDSIEKCIENIKIGATNICVQLPEEFVIKEGKVNTIRFYVDQSRTNLVESVIGSVSSTIGAQSEEISLSLTQNLVDAVDAASSGSELEAQAINKIRESLTIIQTSVNSLKTKGGEIDLIKTKQDLETAMDLVKDINASTGEIKESTDLLLDDLDSLLDTLESDQAYQSKAGLVRDDSEELAEISATETGIITNSTSGLEQNLILAKDELSTADSKLGEINNLAGGLVSETETINSKVAEIESSIQSTKDKINSLQVKSASGIVNQFEVSVNPILSTSDKSIFMFPYFLTLAILFVGIMLSSTLVVMEKKSRAYFRTFTAPTNEAYHILGRYITNVIILFGQLIIILGASYFFIKIPLFENFGVTFAILVLSVSFFVFLGAAIGHLFNTQEGTTIASISIGTLFLFLSNLVLPVESFPPVARAIISASPYMLSSEMIKESLLFNVGFSNLTGSFLLLFTYLLISIAMVVLFQKLSMSRVFNELSTRKILLKPHITKDNLLKMPSGRLAKNKIDLYKELWLMSDKDFGQYVTKKNNEIALWIKEVFKDKELAREIKKARTKDKIILVLEKSAGLSKYE